MRPDTLLFMLIVSCCLISLDLRAEDQSPLFQGRASVGYVNLKFDGPAVGNGSFTSPNLLDLQLEYLKSYRITYHVRSSVLFESSSSSVRYFYAGLGLRYYLWNSHTKTEVSEAGLTFKSVPRWRMYGVGDIGVGNVLVIPLSNILGTYVTQAEASFGLGGVYQLSQDVGVSGQAEFANGFSFTSVSSATSALKLIIGATLFF